MATVFQACFCLLLAASWCHADVLRFKPSLIKDSEKNANLFMQQFKLKSVLSDTHHRSEEISEILKLILGNNRDVKASRLEAFTWKDCGGTGVNISSLSVLPDPLQFPGQINISAVFDINVQISSPLKAELIMKKKVAGQYEKVPCVGLIGSCNYTNVCDLLSLVPTCPSFMPDCKCPIKKGSYKIPSVSIPIDAAAFEEGDFSVQGTFSNKKQMLKCVEIRFSVSR